MLLIDNPRWLHRPSLCSSGLACTSCAKRRSCGMGDYVAILVTDPQFIADLKQMATKKGQDPSLVDRAISLGASGPQLAQAATLAAGGLQQLIATLQGINELTAQVQAQSGVNTPAGGGTAAPEDPVMLWLKTYGVWVGAGLVGLFLVRETLA